MRATPMLELAYPTRNSPSNYTTVNPSNFLIVTNVGLNTSATQVQEFIVRTPEPSSLALLVSGMLALMLLVIRRGRA